MESNRICFANGVLTSHKTILNRFVRHSLQGHHTFFFTKKKKVGKKEKNISACSIHYKLMFIYPSNRICSANGVLTSHKTILNRFVRHSLQGHHTFFFTKKKKVGKKEKNISACSIHYKLMFIYPSNRICSANGVLTSD